MNLLRSTLALVPLLLACSATSQPPSYTGMYSCITGVLEVHHGHDGGLRGYLRANDRIAALSLVEIHGDTLRADAVYDDSSRTTLMAPIASGPALVLDGHEYRRTAVEEPADATVRREIEAAYAKLGQAVAAKDFDAFQALRVAEFATIPPHGIPSPGARMADRARGFLERLQPPIRNTNEILELTVRGPDAIATVRQKLTRMQQIEGKPHEIHTEVTQRETWTRTPEGWKLLFVDEVRDHMTLDDGRRVR